MKESFLNPFRTRLMNYCFIVVSVGFIAAISGYFIKKINTQPTPILSLDGEWKVCAGEECRTVKVPATEDHPFPESASYKHLRYSRNFKTPEFCLEVNCAILFSEIADAGEIRINGQRVAIHGGIGKEFVFSKHYPVFEAVDPSLFKKENLIEVFVETAKIPQSGIRGELNGFYLYKEAKAYVLGRYVYDIFTPIAGAILLLVLCLYTIRKIYRATETRPDLQALAWVLSSMALVLISSSNVPREFLPTWVCAYGHFLLKHAVDWSLFYLAYVFYRERFASLRWMNWWVYFSVAMFMASVFVAQLFLPAMARENHSVIIPFVVMQVLFPLRILPFVLMLIGCFFDKREKPLGRYVSCVVVLCIAYFQISDIALSWGLRTGSYYVRFFPVLLGIFYASKVFEIYDEEMAENAKDGENAKGYRRMGMQAAHDLKSPVLALRHQFRKLNLAKKEADTVLSSLDTIAGITQSLEKDFQHKKELFLSTKLSDLCASVISEKKIEFKDKETLRLIYSCEKDAQDVTSFIDAVELKRVISNLVNNSMQAITLDMQGKIELSLVVREDFAEICITDNGRGISEEKIPMLFNRGVSIRRDGKGLGLCHAKESVSAFAGKIEMRSKLGHGTRVTISLPIERETSSRENIVIMPLAKNKTWVLVEDDQLVIDIWQEEADKANVKLMVFRSPRETSRALVNFDKKNTEFFVDVNFSGERTGAEFAKNLHSLGYKVNLSTSYPAYAFSDYSVLGIGVLGKDPPWSGAVS